MGWSVRDDSSINIVLQSKSGDRALGAALLNTFKKTKLEHVDCKKTSIIPVVFEQDYDSFTLQLQIFEYTFNTHSNLIISTVFGVTVRDIFKAYHYLNKHLDKLDKNVEKVVHTALTTDQGSDNSDGQLLGYLFRGNLYRLPVLYSKEGCDIERFIDSIILFDFTKDITKLESTILSMATDRMVDTLVQYFFHNKPLYIHDETIVFNEPINVKEFIDMIDDNYGLLGTKSRLTRCIFKKCNKREQELLDKYGDTGDFVITHPKQIKAELPIFVFRKFKFTRFSMELIDGLFDAAIQSVFYSHVPKHWKNLPDREKCINWFLYKSPGSKKTRCWNHCEFIHADDERRYIYNQFKHDIKNCNYDDVQETGLTMDCGLKYAYELPPLIEKGLEHNDSIDALCFMTNEEASELCKKIDADGTLSLSEKINQLNIIGYSRIAGDPTRLYKLVQPEAAYGLSEFSLYEIFFGPKIDNRLPKIVLYELLECIPTTINADATPEEVFAEIIDNYY